MDKVVSRQALFKRALEKQLDEIEVRHRQSETRRLKQIRDLGVDLSRIQKTSRDLESTGDLLPRRLHQRRGSLPVLESDEAVPFFLEPPRTPRSGRRYSCIGLHGFPPPDVKEENSDDAFSDTEEADVPSSRFISITATPPFRDEAVMTTSAAVKQNTQNKDLSSVEAKHSTKLLPERTNKEETGEFNSSLPRVRRGSSDTSDNKGKNGNNDGHNVTTVVIHNDSKSVSKEATPQDEETSEADSVTMRRLIKNRGRRKSEPAVGGYFIRRLQATEFSDGLSNCQRNSADSEELKRSIQTNLPSKIVEEKDEEEREADDTNSSTESATDLPASLQQKFQLSSISEHDPDSEMQTYSLHVNQTKTATAPKDRYTNVMSNHNSRKPDKFPGFRGRRNSDGDVLSYSHAKKLHEAKHQVWRLHESAYQSDGDRKNFDDAKK